MFMLKSKFKFCSISIFSVFFCTWSALATSGAGQVVTTVPACLDHGKVLNVMDDQVATWKSTTRNQFLARAHVTGTIHRIFPDHSGHNHFEIQMNNSAGDTLELVYNKSFGNLPSLRAGMKVEACGDYITSNHATSQYPASPDGAIMHWIHNNLGGGGAFTAASFDGLSTNKGKGPKKPPVPPVTSGHDAGYVAIEGVVYGGY